MDLACLCDIRIAARGASFAHPEVKFGAPVFYTTLKEIVGGGIARELCLTGRRIDAAEALRIGLVNQLVPRGWLLAMARDLAAGVAEAPQAGLRAAKSMVNRSSETARNWTE